MNAQLLSIIARKLGHDWLLLLRSESKQCEEKQCNAIFGHYNNYDTVLLKANGKSILVKFIDAKGNLRSSDDMYAELVGLLYKILENDGNVSDGMKKLNADDIPEFMLNCVLNGFA